MKNSPFDKQCFAPVGGEDFTQDIKVISIDSSTTTVDTYFIILDDLDNCEDDEQFFIVLTNMDPGSGNCEIPNPQIPVFILDDGRNSD